MKIEYKDANGNVLELEVSNAVGQFYISSIEEEEKNDRKNSRPDRHTSLEAFVYITLSNKTTESGGSHSHSISGSTASIGGGSAHNNLQPYITCYMWKRIE